VDCGGHQKVLDVVVDLIVERLRKNAAEGSPRQKDLSVVVEVIVDALGMT
jgi:hypothetical protein